jgi:dipeptidyl-peptidase-4
MKKYNPVSGTEESVLFEETDSEYIQPLNPMTWNKQGTRFIWQSRRDGYNHLYLYDASGKLLKQLTSGRWEVTEFHGFNQKGTTAFFTANRELPINRDLYVVESTSGKITRLTNGNGVHKCLVNTTGSHILDEFTGPGIPRDTRLIGGTGKQLRTLLSSADPLNSYTPVGIEIFSIRNEHGDSLYCRMLKPAGFDSTRKYPVLVYVYGGPGINLITNNWTGGADMWMRFMAQRGFVVFTLENRGTPNRGKAFEQATFRKLGDVEMEDQIAGVKYLMKKQFVDPARMGLYGWSYGGFMTVSMMTRHPGIFSTAVAGGPVIDWSMYEVMYTERYMDTPESNPEGYTKSNLLNYLGNLKGRMMLIHGTSDDVVVWQHSLLYLKQAVQQNVQLDYFVYPGHEHNVTGKDRIHLLNKVSNYFFEHLQ